MYILWYTVKSTAFICKCFDFYFYSSRNVDLYRCGSYSACCRLQIVCCDETVQILIIYPGRYTETYWLTARLGNGLCVYILVVSSLLSFAFFEQTWTLPCVHSDINGYSVMAILLHHGLGAQRKAMMGQRGVVPNLREGHIGEFIHLQLCLLSIVATQLSLQNPCCCHCRYTHTYTKFRATGLTVTDGIMFKIDGCRIQSKHFIVLL